MLGHLAAATDIYVRLNGDPFTSPHYIFSSSTGEDISPVTLVKGSTYTFRRTDGGHPFNVGDGWKQANPEITVSSTGNGDEVGGAASIGTDEQLTVTIPSDFSGNTLKYFCYAHSSMIETFNVQSNVLDSIKWFHQTQLPSGGSWFNGELQHYTDEDANSYVSDGTLKIVAKKETYTDQTVTKQYTSARLNSKFAFTYGVVEVRAKLPTGRGTWPAIWTLGQNINEAGAYWETQGFGATAWPACGEIDIMEHWGKNQNFVQSALHTPSSHGGTINHDGQRIDTVSTQFHTYSMDWDAERIIFAVDGGVHYTYNPTVKNDQTWPFNLEQFLLLNVAIESDISDSFVESAMEIDYVRVFQKNGDDYEIVWRDEFGDQEDTITPWDVSDDPVDVDQLQRDCASGTSASCSALLSQCTC